MSEAICTGVLVCVCAFVSWSWWRTEIALKKWQENLLDASNALSAWESKLLELSNAIRDARQGVGIYLEHEKEAFKKAAETQAACAEEPAEGGE